MILVFSRRNGRVGGLGVGGEDVGEEGGGVIEVGGVVEGRGQPVAEGHVRPQVRVVAPRLRRELGRAP